jgi:hypothetical protein
MRLKSLLLCSAVTGLALPAVADETRELAAHEHGHGALNIAIEGDQIAIELEVPGFDIVGFEYAAETDADKAAVEAGLAALGDPTALFILPAAAGCTVIEASAELHGEDDHAEGDHAEGEDHDDAHDDHAEGDWHDDHDEAAMHSEFHATYLLTCEEIEKVTSIELSYFERFENAEELEVQLVSDTGATAMEASRAAPVLDLAAAM